MKTAAPDRAWLFVLTILLFGCDSSSEPSGKDGWLKGNPQAKFETLSKHLRGMDMAMVEIGYRYVELFWAGQDQNWEYAAYQVEKIRTSLENGLERRPKRAKSAETFLTIVLPLVKESVEKRDPVLFQERFVSLTSTCNACHEMEQMKFIPVAPPKDRLSCVQATTKR